MLAALNFGALAIGVATGALAASVVALLASGIFTVLGMESGPDFGLVLGVLSGLALGGWMAGRRAVHSHRFHGMVTGLILAFILLVVARLGGSPAGLGSVVWLALLAVIVAGLTGWLAGRQQT